MKQFIVLIAVLPLLMVLMLQFVYEQRNMVVTQQIQAIVYGAKEEARLMGYFPPDLVERTREELLALPGVDGVSFYSPQEKPLARYSLGENRFIDYRVEVSLADVMAGGGVFISPSKNRYIYVLEGYTPSEFVGEGNT
jgi:hypothetical protein